MYQAVIHAHSWLRWVVLAAAVVVLIRAVAGWVSRRAWTPADSLSSRIFVSALDLQVLLGLVLYAGVSPIVRTALSDLGAAMRDGMLRFWAVEHTAGMLVALIIAHVGHARARRATTAAARHRLVAISTALALLIIFLSIPWPSSSVGRPLLRW